MSLVLKDRVRETATVVGTGDAALLGAVTGFQSFSVVGNTNTCYYAISDQSGGDWEVGIGTYSTTGPTLARTTVLASSNSGSKVSFTGGTKDVFLTYPSEKAVYLDASDVLNVVTIDATTLEVTNIKAKDGTASITLADSTGVATFSANPIFNAATANGVVYANGSKVLTTGSALTFDGTTLNFGGTAQRITGDFSNATLTNRLMLQTSAVNSASDPAVLPNGTSTTAAISVFNNSDPTNAAFGQFGARSGDVRLLSAIAGTGTYLPMTFFTGNSERMRIDSSGNVGIGTSSPSAKLEVVGEVKLGSTSTGATLFQYSTANWNYSNLNLVRNASNIGSARFISFMLDGDSYTSTTIGDYNAIWGAYDSAPTTGSTSSALNGAMVYGAYAGHRWYTNGTERMRIDSSGNVGIGGVPAAWATRAKGLQFDNGGLSASLSVLQSGLAQLGSNFYSATSTDNYTANGVATRYYQYNGTHVWESAASGTAGGTITWSERMRIDSSGNVGIGTSSPAQKLHVSSSVSGAQLQLTYPSVRNFTIGATSDYALAFRDVDAATERMRITAEGEVRIAGTTDQGAYNLQCNGTGVWGAGAYVNGSDAALKENVTTLDNSLGLINAMRPVTFTYKEDYSKDRSVQTGFIAQELQEVLAGKDYLDGIVQAGPEHLNVAYQNLIPLLVKAVQELTARVAQLEGN